MRRRCVRQHSLGHQLGRAIGIDRKLRIILDDRHALRFAVHRRGRGKEDVLHPGVHRGADQPQRGERVVGVIFQRVLDRFRNHDRPGEMHDRADPALVDDAVEKHRLGDRALVERHVVGHDLARAVRQIVNHRDAPAGVLQRQHGMAADITGAAGDEDCGFGHAAALAKRATQFQPSRATVCYRPIADITHRRAYISVGGLHMMLKDDAEHSIPDPWRTTFRHIANAFVAGDYELAHHPVEGVALVAPSTAEHIASSVSGYGEALAPLNDSTWERSIYRWMDGYWQLLVDLATVVEPV